MQQLLLPLFEHFGGKVLLTQRLHHARALQDRGHALGEQEDGDDRGEDVENR